MTNFQLDYDYNYVRKNNNNDAKGNMSERHIIRGLPKLIFLNYQRKIIVT